MPVLSYTLYRALLLARSDPRFSKIKHTHTHPHAPTHPHPYTHRRTDETAGRAANKFFLGLSAAPASVIGKNLGSRLRVYRRILEENSRCQVLWGERYVRTSESHWCMCVPKGRAWYLVRSASDMFGKVSSFTNAFRSHVKGESFC